MTLPRWIEMELACDVLRAFVDHHRDWSWFLAMVACGRKDSGVKLNASVRGDRICYELESIVRFASDGCALTSESITGWVERHINSTEEDIELREILVMENEGLECEEDEPEAEEEAVTPIRSCPSCGEPVGQESGMVNIRLRDDLAFDLVDAIQARADAVDDIRSVLHAIQIAIHYIVGPEIEKSHPGAHELSKLLLLQTTRLSDIAYEIGALSNALEHSFDMTADKIIRSALDGSFAKRRVEIEEVAI